MILQALRARRIDLVLNRLEPSHIEPYVSHVRVHLPEHARARTRANIHAPFAWPSTRATRARSVNMMCTCVCIAVCGFKGSVILIRGAARVRRAQYIHVSTARARGRVTICVILRNACAHVSDWVMHARRVRVQHASVAPR